MGIGAAVAIGTYVVYRLLCVRNKHKNKNPKAVQVALVDATVKYPFKLHSKEVLTHDTVRYRFALNSEDQVLGLPLGYMLCKKKEGL